MRVVGADGSALSFPFRGSGFGSQDMQARFTPIELRETLVTALGIPGSHLLQDSNRGR